MDPKDDKNMILKIYDGAYDGNPIFLPAAKPAGLWMILSFFFREDLSNRAL